MEGEVYSGAVRKNKAVWSELLLTDRFIFVWPFCCV